MNNHKRLKDTKRLVQEIYSEHPDWNAKQVRERYLILVGDTNKVVTLNAIQKHLEDLRDNNKTIKQSGIDNPWHLGLLSHPFGVNEKVAQQISMINSDAIPYILKVQQWARDNDNENISIREVLWINRLFRTQFRDSNFKPVKSQKELDNAIKNLRTVAEWYATYEWYCELTGHDFDTTRLDWAYWNGAFGEFVSDLLLAMGPGGSAKMPKSKWDENLKDGEK